MLNEPVPASFILQKTTLSAPELKWAFESGFIGARTVVDVARNLVSNGECCDKLVELSETTNDELHEVKYRMDAVDMLMVNIANIRRKWVWLILSWVYEQHHDDPTVFDYVDAWYADFSYPEEMIAFGPYAPAYQAKDDPSETRERVLSEWRDFLKRGAQEFGRPQ